MGTIMLGRTSKTKRLLIKLISILLLLQLLLYFFTGVSSSGATTPETNIVKFSTDESTDRVQTHTIKLPGLKQLNEVTVNNGNVEVINVEGEQVTVRVSEGEVFRKEQTGGSLIPEDTIWVTGQTSINYNNDGYAGTLTSYVHSGSYTPGETKNIYIPYTLTGQKAKNFYGEASTYPSYTTDFQEKLDVLVTKYFPSSFYYNHKGFSGTLYPMKFAYGHYQPSYNLGGSTFYNNSPMGIIIENTSIFIHPYTENYSYTDAIAQIYFQGDVTSVKDTRVYRYQGYVTRPELDTRTFENFYQYDLTFDYSDDLEPPSIRLIANPSSFTNKDVNITSAIKDEETRKNITEESRNRTQTHTIKLPGLKKMNRALVDTGDIEILEVNGDEVTVRVSGGDISRREQTGGTYTPAQTKNVTNQSSANYSDAEGYTGPLSRYLHSGSLVPPQYENRYVEQKFTNRSDGVPVNNPSIVCGKSPYGHLEYLNIWNFWDYSQIYTCSDSNGDGIARETGGPYKVTDKMSWSFGFTISYEVYKQVEVSPGYDNRVYRYQGAVTKPAVDTRTYDDYYQYNVTFDYEKEVPVQKWAKGDQLVSYFKDKGNNLVDSVFTVAENGVFTVYAEDLAGNASVKTITIDYIDKDAPKITLSPSTVQPTNKSVTVTVTVVDASPIPVKKWAAGLKDIKYFSTSGETLQSNFDVKENGIYTVYAIDAAGNESIQTINVNNVFIGAPAKPEFLVSPTVQTNENATISISFPSNMISNLYRINGGTWKEYTEPITLSSNGSIEAKAKNPLGVWSDVGLVHVTNVDKQGPTIELDSNPKDITPFDVEITADIKDSETDTFYTAESQEKEQIQVFHIPGLKDLKDLSVENGNAEIVKVDGEYVTVRFTGGTPVRRELISGELIPEQTKFISRHNKPNYSDAQGYSGTLNLVYGPEVFTYDYQRRISTVGKTIQSYNTNYDSKRPPNAYVSPQWLLVDPWYIQEIVMNPQSIRGLLNFYDSYAVKYGEKHMEDFFSDLHDGQSSSYRFGRLRARANSNETIVNKGPEKRGMDGGTLDHVMLYSIYMNETNFGSFGNMKTVMESKVYRNYLLPFRYTENGSIVNYDSHNGPMGSAGGLSALVYKKNGEEGVLYPDYSTLDVSYRDLSYGEYNCNRNSVCFEITTKLDFVGGINGRKERETYYSGTVTKPAVDNRVYDDYYQYKVTFDYEKNVPVQKWAEGEPSLSFFKDNGNQLVDSKFSVSENGTYSVYAMDDAGNETIEVIEVDNIMKEPPLPPSLSASPTVPTNGNVNVTISYPPEAVVREYRVDDGNWINYNAPIIMTQNGTVEARGQNEAGIWSDYSHLEVNNIDKIAPVINLIPDTTAATNQNIIVEANITDNANEIIQKKWTEGEQDALFFRLAGYNLGLAFTATENGTYTVYAKDAAGNESVETITINNIHRTTPDGPIITGNPTTPTNEDVQISISYPSSLTIKQYRINHGSWSSYSGPFNMRDIGTVEARGQDVAGNWSDKTTYIVNNINKDKPEISLSANPTTPTNQDVTITSDIKDIDKKVFNTTESMEREQTQTFTVPGMHHLKNIEVNTGNAEIINIDGDQVTIKFTGGVPSGQIQTGGTLIPAHTKFVTNQNSALYNSDGYGGMLTRYLHSGSYSSGGSKFHKEEILLSNGSVNAPIDYTMAHVIPGQWQWENWSFMYEGYIPLFQDITNAGWDSPYEKCTGNLDPYYSCLDKEGYYNKKTRSPVGYPYLTRPFDTPTKEVWDDLDNLRTLAELKSKHPQYWFSIDGYYGDIRYEVLSATSYPTFLYYKWGSSTGFLKPNWNSLRKITEGPIYGFGGSSNQIVTGMMYEGYVTSQPVDTRVYRYQGNVTKPAVDTRTFEDTYQYSVTFEYETDVAEKKWAEGNQSVEFFDNEGTILLGYAFKVSENGDYTVYAKDAAGNASVETITITNIDKEPPSITLEQIPVRPVNVDVTVVATITDNVAVAEQKYAIGNQDTSYFANGGTVLTGDRFVVPENGTYTVYARDTAGNETVETITISNIDRVNPESASFTAEPTAPTNQDVYVTILYPIDAFVKEYKIGEDGRWRVYSEPIRMTSNGLVFARSRDMADNRSEVSSYEVTNIDKWAPVILLSESAADNGVSIHAEITDRGSGIEFKKYAPGKQSASYFTANGSSLNGNSFQVEKNGTYSVYASDIAGNETVKTISIMKIPIPTPPIGGGTPEAPGGDLSFTGNSPDKINTVTVHTPVVLYAKSSDDKEHDQRTNPPERSTPANPDKDRHAYILDRPFEVTLPTDGQHLDESMAPGYGNRDFAKYVREKQVRFPFDVYTETKQGFYPKDTWINVPVGEATSTFFMPVWVPEGKYTVDFRTFAINANAPSQVLEEHEANLNLDYRTPNAIMENHVAIDSIEVDVVGRLYDFRVTDILDYQWGPVFRPTEGLVQHTGNYFWIGKYGIDGDPRGNEKPFTLPIRHGSHPDGYPNERKNVAVKTGYQFKFDFKTKGDMFESKDGVRITPSFYFVDKNGNNRRPVDIYYHNDANYFVQIGSEKDTEYRSVKLNEPLRNVEEKQLYDTAAYLYKYPQGDLAQFADKLTKEMFISNFIKKYSKEGQVTGPYGSQLLNRNLRTFIGPDSNEVPNTSMIPVEDAVAREQMWYGEYSLPADIYVVDEGKDIGGYGVQHRLNKNSPIFLQDGYVIVNFHIETLQDGKTEASHLEYFKNPLNHQYTGPLNNQWQMEGFEYDFTDAYGNYFELQDGDVLFYHGDQSSYDDFGANVTH